MMKPNQPVVYWDTSAILSALFKDEHSEKAKRLADQEGVHLISSLGYSEACAVLSRIRREGLLTGILVQAAFEVLETGPWRRIHLSPAWEDLRDLSTKWPLRGADLWHLAAAKRIQQELPELSLFTFDERLKSAADGEGL
jgi:predicted nucleic acid-binding protein